MPVLHSSVISILIEYPYQSRQGRHHYGNFICIPNHDAGCGLSDYSDVFWNRERLSGQLKKVNAVTVACTLPHLKEL